MLLREIQARGYAGGISQLKAHLAPFKQAAADPVVRFETAPGRQMQVDFTTVRRGRDRLLAFVATMGYSRASFVRFTQREDFAAWRDGLLGAFEYFGGVPAEVLFDNAKPVVIERDLYGPGLHRWHPGMLDLARELRLPAATVPAVPGAHQGQGRALQRLLKGSFLVPLAATLRAGGLTLDLDTANREVLRWLDEVANRRIARHDRRRAVRAARAKTRRRCCRCRTACARDRPQRCGPSARSAPRTADRVAAASAVGVRGAARGGGMSLQPERIAQLCELLKLPAIHAEWSAFAQRAAHEESTFADFLESVLVAERAARTERVRQTLLKLATLPAVKTLESYDFAFATRRAEVADPGARRRSASSSAPRTSCCSGRPASARPILPSRSAIVP